MDGIKCFLTSKKAITLIENKKYSFLVQRWIKKDTIKTIIENKNWKEQYHLPKSIYKYVIFKFLLEQDKLQI